MRRRSLLPVLAAVVLSLGMWMLIAPALPAVAQSSDEDVRRIGRQLSCPVCEGQNVADSNAGLAQEMRAVIRLQLDQGRTDQQVLDSFVQAYGAGILTDPPKSGASLGVWIAPVLVAGLGAVLLGWLLSRWIRPARSDRRGADPREVAVDAAVLEELSHFRQGQRR